MAIVVRWNRYRYMKRLVSNRVKLPHLQKTRLSIVTLFFLNTQIILEALVKSSSEKRIQRSTLLVSSFLTWESSVFLICALSLLPSAISKWLILILCWISGLLFVVDMYMLITYQTLADKAAIYIILDTDVGEVIDYLVQFLLSGKLLMKTLCLMVIMGSAYFLVREACQFQWFDRIVRFTGILSIFSVFLWFPKYNSVVRFGDFFIQTADEFISYRKAVAIANAVPVSIIQNNSSLDYFVLILGESQSRTHMSLYGYPLHTTPRMDIRSREGELFIFNDTISCHSYTAAVMREAFTFMRHDDDRKPFYTYGNLFSILKTAGFHTVWLSNQEIGGRCAKPSRIYADLCSEKHFTMKVNIKKYNALPKDEVLLPLLDRSLHSAPKHSFIVLHLHGAHYQYRYRYPEEFGIYSAADELSLVDCYNAKLTQAQLQNRAEYDNALVYVDSVADRIIKRFEDKKAVVMFTSDHGEDVYDTPENLRADHGDYLKTSRTAEIPFVVWLSRSARETNPDVVRSLEHALARPYMNDDLIHTILDILNIHTPEYNPTYSILNEQYLDQTRRITGDIDYSSLRTICYHNRLKT